MIMSYNKLGNINKRDVDRGTARPVSSQVKAVVDFIEQHPELSWKVLSSDKGPHKVKQLWMELTNIANSIEGARKTTHSWMKFWQDKRRSVAIKNRLIKQGKIEKPLSSIEQRILKLCSLRNKKLFKALKEEQGDDDSISDVCPSDNVPNGSVSRAQSTEATEFDERSCNLMDAMIEVMGKQAMALSQIAQESLTKSKAMEQIAEASHRQELGYKSIQVLDLSYNQIFWIGLHAFFGLDHLLDLNLSNNRLRYLPSDVFWYSPQLDILDLSANVFESLKNEPFIMHNKLQVLNLNSCRIKSLPERLFTRLPNLKKLDLSENYLVTINLDVLRPLRKLNRLELRNDYWQCNANFIATETWIASRGIVYEKFCKKIYPKMSEKIISMVQIERKPVDIDGIWNLTDKNNTRVTAVRNETKPLTPFQIFDRNFSALQAFVIGLEIGLAIGIIATYMWLRRVCFPVQLRCRRPQTGRERRRIRREGDMRNHLLWNAIVHTDMATPPIYRRQVLPVESVPNNTQLSARRETNPNTEDVRSETPPPPYHECRLNT